jgi:hypothetical protein
MPSMTGSRIHLLMMAACCAAGLVMSPAAAQQQPGGWQAETRAPGAFLPGLQQGGQQGGQQGAQQTTQGTGSPAQTQQDLPPNTTVVPRTRTEPKSGGVGQVSLSALLTDDGQSIEQGLVWRVYRDIAGPDGKARLVSTHREANPTVRLDAGDYFINVALGRANLTRKITVVGERTAQERTRFTFTLPVERA